MLTMTLRLEGTRSLLMHNGRLADPRNELTARLHALRMQPRTEATEAAARKLEWLGGLCTDQQQRVALSEDAILAAGLAGARYLKRDFEVNAAVMGAAAFFPLEYDGPKDIQQLYASGRFIDCRGVMLRDRRFMRVRPRFDQWALNVALIVDESVIDPRDVVAAYDAAGRLVGLGDYRPRFGRFTVELVG